MIRQFRAALAVLFMLTVVTGVIYPLAITGIAQLVFPHQENGSLIMQNGKAVGSELIGQQFSNPKYFWGRLSATGDHPYNAYSAQSLTGSSGSNYGPINPALVKAVRARVDALKAADPGNNAAIPVDLVTASGSGLDPDISVAAALYQAPRVARLRGLPLPVVEALIAQYTQPRQFGFLGEPRVKALELNLALDGLAK